MLNFVVDIFRDFFTFFFLMLLLFPFGVAAFFRDAISTPFQA
jgi:hypothetical protein